MKRPSTCLSDLTSYTRQCVDEVEATAVRSFLLSGNLLTGGEEPGRLEKRFAHVFNLVHEPVAVCSNTAGLRAVFNMIPPGVVLVPSLTFVASANAPLLAGHDVRLVDVDYDTGLLDPKKVQEALRVLRDAREHVSAILAVDFAGQEAVTPALREVCPADCMIVQDAAHSVGRGPSFYADYTVYSFHGAKNMTTGEGGMVCSSHDLSALRNFVHQGCSRGDSAGMAGMFGFPYDLMQVGDNCRMSDIAAIVGQVQFDKLMTTGLPQRDKLIRRYRDNLGVSVSELGRGEISLVGKIGKELFPAHFAPVNARLRLEETVRLRTMLTAAGIGSQWLYTPMHWHANWRKSAHAGRCGRGRLHEVTGRTLEETDRLAVGMLGLPLFPAMTEDDVDFITDTLKETVACIVN